jgi:tetratricopeptide (TPR) repeat protein
VAQRTARQWFINIVLVIITLSFLGISMAPLLGSIISAISSPQQTNTAKVDPAQRRIEELKEQLRGYEAVLKREPKNQTALIEVVNLRTQLGDIKGTLEPLQTLANAYPDQPQFRMALARTHLELGDRNTSKAELKKILSTNPGFLMALDRLIQLELEDKRPEAAIGVIKEVLDSAETANKIQPNSVDVATVQWILGEVYREQKRYPEAIAAYEAGIKADDKNFRPYLGKAQVLRAQENIAEATALFSKAIELAPPEFKDRVKSIAQPAPTVTVEPVPEGSPTGKPN